MSLLDGDIDLHALGGQKDAYKGLWHAIPSRDCAYCAAVIKSKSGIILMNIRRTQHNLIYLNHKRI